jgi:hypothetical protein
VVLVGSHPPLSKNFAQGGRARLRPNRGELTVRSIRRTVDLRHIGFQPVVVAPSERFRTPPTTFAKLHAQWTLHTGRKAMLHCFWSVQHAPKTRSATFHWS